MAKDPAFLFYSSDFLTGVIDMTMEERGQYITLMCLQHQKGHLSEETIRFCVGSVSDKVLSKYRKDEDGLYFNKRLDTEIDKRENFVESRQKNGKKGGRPPKAKTDRFSVGYPTENLPENEDENENTNAIESVGDFEDDTPRARPNVQEERFGMFWSAYPKKVGKGAAKKSWTRIKPSADLLKKILAAIADAKESEQWLREDGRYIPNPSTWLNQGRWEDELTKKGGGVNGGATGHSGGFKPSTGFRQAGDDGGR